MRAVFRTDKGKIRLHNEDNGGIFQNKANQSLAIVADGMGGHRAGDVASTMTLTNIKRMWEKSKGFRRQIKQKSGKVNIYRLIISYLTIQRNMKNVREWELP